MHTWGHSVFCGEILMPKEFKTIAEQIDLFKKRGLTITDEKAATSFLLENNYYRISGYSLTLRKHDQFYNNTTFDNIMDIYYFDYELRIALLKYIAKIEIKFKSIYAYLFCQKYGPMGYLESSHFTDLNEYNKIIQKTKKQVKKSLSNEAFIRHYLLDLNEDLPFWAYIEVFSISDISRLYKISDKQLKQDVAEKMGFELKNRDEIVEKYMHGMTIIRNFCAHNCRLFNRLFATKPYLKKKDKQLLILDRNGNRDNNHLFGFILNMQYLLCEEDYKQLKNDIVRIKNKYPFVNLK